MELLRLGPGDHFGEIGMLTGAGAIARISALTPTTVYELAKADLTPILEARPQATQLQTTVSTMCQSNGWSKPKIPRMTRIWRNVSATA